jgi:hypothetical protein
MQPARWFAFAISASILVTASVASAAEPDRPEVPNPAIARPITLAPLVGAASTLGLGVGARAGVNVTPGLYVGGQFMYHPGYSYGAYYGGSSWSATFLYPSGEVGYDMRAARGHLMVRPYAGVGLLVASVSGTDARGKSTSDSATALGVYPGCVVAYDIPRTAFYAGGDARLLFAFASGTGTSFGAFGTVGARF